MTVSVVGKLLYLMLLQLPSMEDEMKEGSFEKRLACAKDVLESTHPKVLC